MKTYTNEDLRKKEACYDPSRHFEEDMGYTLLDYLNHDTCPPKDKIWCVTRFLDDRSNRLFAVWCAKEALEHVENPDPRSLKAIEVAEKFASGGVSYWELGTANLDAYAVAEDAYTYAAYDASCDDACDAAYDSAEVLANAPRCSFSHDTPFERRKKQIEKLKKEIQEGNWKEK